MRISRRVSFPIPDAMSRSNIIVALATVTALIVLLLLFEGWENLADGSDCDRPELSGNGGAGHEQAMFDTAPFITTWQTFSANDMITISVGGATGSYTILWGDGSNSMNVLGDQGHTYRNAGTYTVAITGGFERIYLNGDRDNACKLQSIEQWGDISWTSMNSAFEGATNMIYNAADSPDLSGVTDMSEMFSQASSFNADLSEWDVSEVLNMAGMFSGASSFNSDLSEWDVPSVTDMSEMFSQASSFNADLSEWDVSEVLNMAGMFSGASSFNSDLSEWDAPSVTDMSEMFSQASSFNADLSEWDVSEVLNMAGMFSQASSFNSDISEWDVSSTADMEAMFVEADSFNSDISEWDVSSVTDMSTMFDSASSFNSDISEWDVSEVSNMAGMFSGASSFNSDISEWDVSSVTEMSNMFSGASSFNSDISEWDVSSVTDMSHMFHSADSFNSDLSEWDVSSVRHISGMFAEAYSFNKNMGNWYIVLHRAFIDIGNGTEIIGYIIAQNWALDQQDLTYGIGSGGDSALFAIDEVALKIRPSANYSSKTEYTVNVTSTGDFGTNNFRMIDIMVTGGGNEGSP